MGTQDYNLIDVDNKNELWYVYYIIIPVAALIVIGIVIVGIVMYIKKRKSLNVDDKEGQGLFEERETSKDE